MDHRIGNDAAAPEDLAAVCGLVVEGVFFGRRFMCGTVGPCAVAALFRVVILGQSSAHAVFRTVYAASRRSVVVRGCQLDMVIGILGNLEDRLHRTLTEGRIADDDAAIPVRMAPVTISAALALA